MPKICYKGEYNKEIKNIYSHSNDLRTSLINTFHIITFRPPATFCYRGHVQGTTVMPWTCSVLREQCRKNITSVSKNFKNTRITSLLRVLNLYLSHVIPR